MAADAKLKNFYAPLERQFAAHSVLVPEDAAFANASNVAGNAPVPLNSRRGRHSAPWMVEDNDAYVHRLLPAVFLPRAEQ